MMYTCVKRALKEDHVTMTHEFCNTLLTHKSDKCGSHSSHTFSHHLQCLELWNVLISSRQHLLENKCKKAAFTGAHICIICQSLIKRKTICRFSSLWHFHVITWQRCYAYVNTILSFCLGIMWPRLTEDIQECEEKNYSNNKLIIVIKHISHFQNKNSSSFQGGDGFPILLSEFDWIHIEAARKSFSNSAHFTISSCSSLQSSHSSRSLWLCI